MDGRAFLAALGALSLPLGASAQQGKTYRIGYLALANPRSASPFFLAFEARRRELGYVEGQNLSIEFRNA